MSQPKVSVIIPTYNREKFIAECIQSALTQSYANIEIIVSDNASTDRTWDICQEIAKQDQRVVLVRNETNIGPVRNWIEGIKKASGEYCKILFSDDGLKPDCLEIMVPKLAPDDVGFVYCAAQIGATSDTAARVEYQLPSSSRITPATFTELLIAGKAPVSPGAVLLRTADIRKNLHTTFPTSVERPYARNGAGPDAMIMLLTSRDYPAIEHISTPLVFFRAHADSFTVSANTTSEVEKGYKAVIPYFLKLAYGRAVWLRYLSRTWRLERRRSPETPGMRDYLRQHEGQGSLGECLGMLAHMLIRPIRKRRLGGHFYMD